MSGSCLTKTGKIYTCDACENSRFLRPEFSYCPYCGEEFVMYWDGDTDSDLEG